jgi:predicted transglutaminase-like cysteine proteinase
MDSAPRPNSCPSPRSPVGGSGFVLALFLLLIFAAAALTEEPFRLSQQVLTQASQQYGPEAEVRLLAWQRLIHDHLHSPDPTRIDVVNRFFNRLRFVDDLSHWNTTDHWATPIEFLASGGGDCEDFSIAKFFTLKAMGLEENKLNITYVKALKLNQAHMVLTYYPTPAADPLVLDNLTDAIVPASQRPDLLPVYAFNGTGLWLAKRRGQGEMVGSSDRLQRWQEMLERMNRQLSPPRSAPTSP